MLRVERVAARAESTLKPSSSTPFPLRWAQLWQQATPRTFSGLSLSYCHNGNLLELHLHRSPCNEIGEAMLEELEHFANYLRTGAGGARAIIITSDLDTGFSAGADLRGLHQAIQDRQRQGTARWLQLRELRRFLDRIHHVFNTLDSVPLVTVSAVFGPCFGGGFELALTSDLIVADKSARFCFPELRLGLIPGFGGIPRLRRDVGNAAIRDLVFSGRSLRAGRAHELGLVSQLTGNGKAFEVAARLAEQTTRFGEGTIRASKRFAKPIPYSECEQEKDVFLRLFATEPVAEALADFVSRDDALPYLP